MTEKITELTPEQRKKMHEFRDEWMQIGLAKGRADVEACRDAVNHFYAELGYEAPTIVRVPSPMAAQVLINIIQNEDLILREADGVARPESIEPQGESEKEQNAIQQELKFQMENPAVENWPIKEPRRSRYLSDDVMDALARADAKWSSMPKHVLAQALEDLPGARWEYSSTSLWGSLDSYWIAFYLFPHMHLRPMHTKEQMVQLNHWATLAKNSFWWYPFEGFCIHSDRPDVIELDDEGRLHCETGPAVAFPDHWTVYVWHGIRVPEKVIEHPERITVEEVDNEQNVEIRRIMLERMGWGRYIEESDAELIDTGVDPSGNPAWLYRRTFDDDEPIVMLKMTNTTPERDGSYKHYFERVHPELRPLFHDGRVGEPQVMTVHNALASRFGLRGEEYAPIQES